MTWRSTWLLRVSEMRAASSSSRMEVSFSWREEPVAWVLASVERSEPRQREIIARSIRSMSWG